MDKFGYRWVQTSSAGCGSTCYALCSVTFRPGVPWPDFYLRTKESFMVLLLGKPGVSELNNTEHKTASFIKRTCIQICVYSGSVEACAETTTSTESVLKGVGTVVFSHSTMRENVWSTLLDLCEFILIGSAEVFTSHIFQLTGSKLLNAAGDRLDVLSHHRAALHHPSAWQKCVSL